MAATFKEYVPSSVLGTLYTLSHLICIPYKQDGVIWKSLSHVWLFAIPWTVGCQAPLSTEFSRQEYWSGEPFPSPGDLPNPGIKPRSPSLQEDSLRSEPPQKPKNIGSLPPLHGIFPTKESNRGLLHCRWILYHLSHQGIPRKQANFKDQKTETWFSNDLPKVTQLRNVVAMIQPYIV